MRRLFGWLDGTKLGRLTMILVPSAALLFIVASCEENVTNLTIVHDSTDLRPCPDSVRTRYCLWSNRAHSWICLDAPLPKEPPDHDEIISLGEKTR